MTDNLPEVVPPLTAAQDLAAMEYAASFSVERAAKAAGVSPHVVENWLTHPNFRAIREARYIANYARFLDKLHAMGDKAFDVLSQALLSENQNICVKAASFIARLVLADALSSQRTNVESLDAALSRQPAHIEHLNIQINARPPENAPHP